MSDSDTQRLRDCTAYVGHVVRRHHQSGLLRRDAWFLTVDAVFKYAALASKQQRSNIIALPHVVV
jgi:hypothetical protein